MPLIKSASKKAVGENIKRETAAGKPRRTAIAIALDVQRRARKADGGAVISDAAPLGVEAGTQYAQASGPYVISIQGGGRYSVVDQRTGQVRYTGTIDGARQAQAQLMSGRATGGRVGYADGGATPFYARSAAKQLEHSGMIHSPVAGRTDRIGMGVKPGSYVLPADVLSGLGQGNSLSGAQAVNKLFGMAPGGASMPHPRAGAMKIPTGGMMKGRKGFADGGDVEPTQIVAAGGEFVIPSEKVMEIGGGDLDHGHAILDQFVKQTRARTIKTLRKLPGPSKD